MALSPKELPHASRRLAAAALSCAVMCIVATPIFADTASSQPSTAPAEMTAAKLRDAGMRMRSATGFRRTITRR